MSATIIEEQRQCHEELERLQDALVAEKLHKTASHREHINSEHRAFVLYERLQQCTTNLISNYDDKDGIRKREIDQIGGPNEFQEFYNRLRKLKDYHKKHSNEIASPMVMEFLELKNLREVCYLK